MMPVWSRSNLKLKEKLPKLTVIAIIAIFVSIIVLDTLEDMLIEVGFEYVTDMDGKKLFRKRK
jgi:hypothetical protein